MSLRTLGSVLVVSLLLASCGGAGSGGFMGQSSEKTKKSAELQVQMAQEYLKKNDLETARDKLKRALELDPYSAQAHTMSGFLNETIKDMVLAELHYRRAVELLPKDGGMNNNFGSFLCRQGRYEEADVMFQRAIADPYYRTREAALTNAGVCAKDAGQIEQAELYLRQSLDFRPDYAPALFPMSAVMFARGDHMRARAFLQRFESSHPVSPESLRLGMKIEQALGDTRNAEDYRRRLTSSFPRSPEAKSVEAQE